MNRESENQTRLDNDLSCMPGCALQSADKGSMRNPNILSWFMGQYRMLAFCVLLVFVPAAMALQLLDDADQPIRTSVQNPNAVALVLAIQDYQNRDVPKVEFAVNDAEAVRRVLTQTLGYSESRVLLRKNDDVSGTKLKLLVRQDLRSRIVSGQSDVFLYYSGHGAPNVDTREGYLIPWDYDPQYVPSSDSAYSLKELYSDLSKLGARSVTVVLEACFSGVSEAGALVKAASPLNIIVDRPVQSMPNGLVISASGPREIATWYSDRKHGLMTYYWLHAMHGEAGDAGGRVTPDSLRRFLQDKVPVMAQQLRGRNQTPDVIADAPDRILAQLPVSALRAGEATVVARTGILEIFIDIGGDLYIDGVRQGAIDPGKSFVDTRYPAGSHRIEIRKQGYETKSETIVIVPDERTTRNYLLSKDLPSTGRLDPVYGQIQVSADRGGTLYVDGKREQELPPFAPYTTARLEAGAHRVRVEKQGFTTVDEEVILRPNETARLELSLKAVSPPVRVPSSPPVGTPGSRCAQESVLKSTAGAVATKLQFVNRSTGPVILYWLDYDGKRVFYSRLAVGETIDMDTYVTHPWLVTIASGSCLGVYLPQPKPSQIVIQ
jgi:hypothetical protein